MSATSRRPKAAKPAAAKKLKAPRLMEPGSSLALAAPSGAFAEQDFKAGYAVLQSLALKLEILAEPEIYNRSLHLAGPDELRAGHLTHCLTDPSIGLTMAVRGGFGASRLLKLLPWRQIIKNRPGFLGFSDLTALHAAFFQKGLISLHGPVLTQLPRLDQDSLNDLKVLLAGQNPWPAVLKGETLAGGLKARPVQGRLMGGNLTMLCHLMGAGLLADLSEVILFWEEVHETPHRLDRLLTQLELAGVWSGIKGLAIGALGGLEAGPQELADLAEVVRIRLGGLKIPVIWGLPFGHGRANRLLPVGSLAELKPQSGELVVGLDYA